MTRIARNSRCELLWTRIATAVLNWQLKNVRRRPQFLDLFVRPFDVVGASILAAGRYESAMLDAIENIVRACLPDARESSLAVDVGANFGNHAIAFGRFFKAVWAFEAHPAIALVCQANAMRLSASNVRVFSFGLGERSGSHTLYENTRNLGESTLVRPAERGDEFHEVQISVRRGDEVTAEHGGDLRVGVIKVDVEGFELSVLKGLRSTIDSDSPLIFFEAHTLRQILGVQAFLNELRYDYFYSIEKRFERPRWPLWAKSCVRLLVGADLYLSPIREFQDRFYNLILAARSPLNLATTRAGEGPLRALRCKMDDAEKAAPG